MQYLNSMQVLETVTYKAEDGKERRFLVRMLFTVSLSFTHSLACKQ